MLEPALQWGKDEIVIGETSLGEVWDDISGETLRPALSGTSHGGGNGGS